MESRNLAMIWKLDRQQQICPCQWAVQQTQLMAISFCCSLDKVALSWTGPSSSAERCQTNFANPETPKTSFFFTDIDVYSSTVLFKRNAQFANYEAGTIICISLPLSREQWDWNLFWNSIYILICCRCQFSPFCNNLSNWRKHRPRRNIKLLKMPRR